MSAIGSGADHALAESFNATFERETLQGRRHWSSERETRLDAFLRLRRYNPTPSTRVQDPGSRLPFTDPRPPTPVEQMIGKQLAQARTDLTARRILHDYAVWHHLRRLRRIGDQHTTQLQDINVRCHVTAADNFLTRLAAQGLALGTCTQADLERWMADPAFTYRDETGHFVRWSVQHSHVHGLTFGTVRRTGPQGTGGSEKRWVDARRLLTVDDVNITGETVAITFGTSPVVLPIRWPPWSVNSSRIDAARPRSALWMMPPWLFPGGQPGRPLSDSQIGLRPRKIGIRPQQDRSTALFTPATELPAAILARMLGVHMQVAVKWQRASAGDWAA